MRRHRLFQRHRVEIGHSVWIACDEGEFLFVPTWLASGGPRISMFGISERYPKDISKDEFVSITLKTMQLTRSVPFEEIRRINTEGNPGGRNLLDQGFAPHVNITFGTTVYTMQPGATSTGPPVAQFEGLLHPGAAALAYEILMNAKPVTSE